MPLRPPACCKAVQRQIHSSPDSIWVSDEALSIVFRRFCSISTTARRYGSSVPGPMECRRRLGKRRMTHATADMPSPEQSLAALWSSLWELDRKKWQWQAPTPRVSNHDQTAVGLPSWLSKWARTPHLRGQEKLDTERVDPGASRLPDVMQDIRKLRRSLSKTDCDDDSTTVLQQFSTTLKKNLALGLVGTKPLRSLLQLSESLGSKQALPIYIAMWEGIETSTVRGPRELDVDFLDRMIRCVASLDDVPAMQVLAQKILHSLSEDQIVCLRASISVVFRRWTESWLSDTDAETFAQAVSIVELLAAEFEQRLANADQLTMALQRSDDDCRFSVAKTQLELARAAVTAAIDGTRRAEDITSPLQYSVRALAFTLGTLPQNILSKVLNDCKRHIDNMGEVVMKSKEHFRYPWLCVVAQMPNVSDAQFLRMWRTSDPSNNFTDEDCVQLVLSRWVSQDKVTKPVAVSNTYSAPRSLVYKDGSSFARLLFALDKNRQRCVARASELMLDILPALGRTRQISDVLLGMKELELTMPTNILSRAVNLMGSVDTQRALDIWYLPWHMKRGYPLRPDMLPGFVLTMVNDHRINSVEIWKLLQIPIYNPRRIRRHRIPIPDSLAKPLSRRRIDLIHDMAKSFACSDSRTPREALRNITQCYHYLRMHRAPISPVISRAVSTVVITRSIARGEIIGLARLKYALRQIEKIEGEKVATEVDGAVFKWRRFVKSKRIHAARARNSLRIGPID